MPLSFLLRMLINRDPNDRYLANHCGRARHLRYVVAVHEYGHFWVARRAGVKVLRFSIGFGKPLLNWRGKDNTEYVIAAIPLGGYVRMADERDGDIAAVDLPGPLTGNRLASAVPSRPRARRQIFCWRYWCCGACSCVVRSASYPRLPLWRQSLLPSRRDYSPARKSGRLTRVRRPPSPLSISRYWNGWETRASLNLAVTRPGSDALIRSEVAIDKWLKGAEQPDLLAALGVTIRTPPWFPESEA
ncbi:MAG: hypothetical protein CM15mP74_22090 [Halieaceae bacterium]|nr:MAG: hypothetical protein CM15mP74_22090 [Halieaceae bacterium]